MSIAIIQATMTSREIADLTGKEHDNVRRDIMKLAEELSLIFEEKIEASQGGRPSKIFTLQKRETLILVSGYSVTMRARIIDRWQELEAGTVIDPMRALSDPATLRQMLLGYTETVLRLEAQIEAAAPAVAFVSKFVEAKSSKCLSDVAKLLGFKPQAFISKLSSDGVIFKRGGSWVPVQLHIDSGRFAVKTGEASGHAFHQTRVTPAGVAWLANRYQAVEA
jgi:phage antirepressor YoqD-like protein